MSCDDVINVKTLLQVESTDDDDCHSNKSLDLNFGKKLIDFKLNTSSSGSAQEEQSSQPSCSSSSSSSSSCGPATSTPQAAPESPEEEKDTPASSSSSSSYSLAAKQQPDYKHVCRVCKKSFRYATTLARHERAHLSEDTPTPPPPTAEEATPAKEEEEEAAPESKPGDEEKEAEMETEEGAKGGDSEGGDSGESEEEEKEKEERSDEEASEPKSLEGGESSGGRVDKRKKICNVCSKRFWSLQDLTRHMRSHTGTTHLRSHTWGHTKVRHTWGHLWLWMLWSFCGYTFMTVFVVVTCTVFLALTPRSSCLQVSVLISVRPVRGPSPWSTAWSGTKGSIWNPAVLTAPLAPTTTPAARTVTPAPRPRPPPARPQRTRVSAGAPQPGWRSWRRRTWKTRGRNRALRNQQSPVGTRILRPPSTRLPAAKLLTQRQLLAPNWHLTQTPPKTPLTPPPTARQGKRQQPPPPRALSRGCWRSTPSPLWNTSCPTESLLWWAWSEGEPLTTTPQCHTVGETLHLWWRCKNQPWNPFW